MDDVGHLMTIARNDLIRLPQLGIVVPLTIGTNF